MDSPILTDKLYDPIWEYTLNAKLTEYIPIVRDFWKNIADYNIRGTGVFDVPNAPQGLMYRVTSTPVRSPIKNVQVFPFLPTRFLNLVNVTGGVNRMISRVCADNKFVIDEFTIVEKSNLPSTYHQGQFIAFIPTDILNSTYELGKWIYFTLPELLALAKGNIVQSVKLKLKRYIH